MSGQDPKDEKKARLEEALRANLRRRKAQARGRKAQPGKSGGEDAASQDPGKTRD